MGRGTETMDVIEFRMNRAKEEALEMDQYDYLIINDDLQECVEESIRSSRVSTEEVSVTLNL